jgi:hypothetical protein
LALQYQTDSTECKKPNAETQISAKNNRRWAFLAAEMHHALIREALMGKVKERRFAGSLSPAVLFDGGPRLTAFTWISEAGLRRMSRTTTYPASHNTFVFVGIEISPIRPGWSGLIKGGHSGAEPDQLSE